MKTKNDKIVLGTDENNRVASLRYKAIIAFCLMAVGVAAVSAQPVGSGGRPLLYLTPAQITQITSDHLLFAQRNALPSSAANFPPSVSLLSLLPYIPVERDQGECADCWAWAGTGVIEIANNVQNGVASRLSVQLLNSCNTTVGCCQGGWLTNVAQFYSYEGFAVPWTNANAAWTSGNGDCATTCGSIATKPQYPISSMSVVSIPTWGISQAQAIANIKAALNQNLAVWFGFFMPSPADWDNFDNFWDTQPESAQWTNFDTGGQWNNGAGHAVLCVGYDDTDPAGPTWIMVNSWGTTPNRTNCIFHVSENINYSGTYTADGTPYPQFLWETLNIQFSQLGYSWTTNADNTLTITGYSGPGGVVTIPGTINGLTVTSIGTNAFQYSSLTSVTIPNSVTSIGDAAFFSSSLANVTIPNSVTKIGPYAFADCINLTAITVAMNNLFYSSTNGVLFNNNQTTLVEYPGGISRPYAIPNSVTSIGDYAFLGASVTAVTIPGSVAEIGIQAFADCSSLTNVTISNGVLSIGDAAFIGCVDLVGVTIPNSVISLGGGVFQYCNNLTNVTLPANLTGIGANLFSGCPGLTGIIIPNTATNVGEYAFYECYSLRAVYFQGNAPGTNSYIFNGDTNAVVYFLPGTTGWGSSFAGLAAILWSFPVTTLQPTNQTVFADGNASFSVSVSKIFPGPFTYQWQLEGTNLPDDIITTAAGGGAGGGTDGLGDGGLALNATLSYPNSVAVDSRGDLFIADLLNNRVREVNTNGIITTVAGGGTGNGTDGLGDGLAATNASLSNPSSVAVDTLGNLFIADQGNNRIRKVSASGIITTVAGGGTGSGSDGLGDGLAATNASLNVPSGIALDASDDLFIADQFNNRIREVEANGIITTVAGGGAGGGTDGLGDGLGATNASLALPSDVTVDASDDLFIADSANNIVREVGANGVITAVAGGGAGGGTDGLGDGGPATGASLHYPTGVAVDTNGNLLIADFYNQRIREVSAGIITAVAGNGTNSYYGDGSPATNAAISDANSVTVDGSDDLFIADSGNNRIRKVTNTQGPSLTFNDVTGVNAGNYQVIVTGPDGSVTSSVVTLTVTVPQPMLQIVERPGGTLRLGWNATPGALYQVQFENNLLSNNWFSLGGYILATNTSLTVTDTIAPNTDRFYRLIATADPIITSATGGNIRFTNDNLISVVFTNSGTFTVLSGCGPVESLVIGGGGSGGSGGNPLSGNGGGGGAGGLIYTPMTNSAIYGPGAYQVGVGIGGQGYYGTGGASYFGNNVYAYGGGDGGSVDGNISGFDGGSGGGDSYGAFGSGEGGTNVLGYKYDNFVSEGFNGGQSGFEESGGGGGAGGIGGTPSGGAGVPFALTGNTNFDTYYAAGGNGSMYGAYAGPSGTSYAPSGAPNSGNGGQGGAVSENGTIIPGSGGSGIVILRYRFQ
jgi:hypothetical protein